MQEIMKNLPDIIKAAASSNLGIVALMLIVLAGLSYGFFRRSNEVWRFSALVLVCDGCLSFGYAVCRSAPEIHSPTLNTDLSSSMEKWIAEAEIARSAKTISPGAQLPTQLLDAKNKFELSWKQSPLVERKALDIEKASKALSYLNRLYRTTENDSPLKPNAIFWADEAIRYFEEIQNKRFLTEAILDKAAIYLDVAQLGHNDKQQFESVARDGDAIMVKAYQIASEDQRPSVLRITSRFYYNLARPKSFRLSDDWDNNYLLLAYEKAKAAYEMAPMDSKNANQLARTVIKASKNPPQDSDKEWTARLRDSQQKLKAVWTANQSGLVGLDQRLSPLNVLGVSTLETVAREWQDLSATEKSSKASKYVSEIDADALSPLREATALLQNSELRKSYGFDLYYDISRAQALKTAIIKTLSADRAKKEFADLKKNLLIAKENAKTSQLEAAAKDIDREITFTFLSNNYRTELHQLISVGAK